MDSSLQVVYSDPGGPGYQCVLYMAHLATELLGGELTVINSDRINPHRKLEALFGRKRSSQPCLLICPSPTDLNVLLLLENWRKQYGRLVAWVFDSFWTENIPRFSRWSRIFDHVFVTEREDMEVWRSKVPAPVDWLPWGSDVWRLGSDSPERSVDLLRFGRQPASWDDDEVSSLACQQLQVRFQGRPPVFENPILSERSLMSSLAQTKFTLSFSNRVNPNPQTHPVREYLTGRWTDALAAGAVVAGIPPRSETAQTLLWPEALLDLGSVHLNEGLPLIRQAVREWSADGAKLNYLRSLQQLDWRWRFARLAESLNIRSKKLDEELNGVRELLAANIPCALR